MLRILGASVQNTVAVATQHPGWEHLTDQK